MQIDKQNRAPQVSRLADSRLRVTRIYDVLNFIPKSPEKLIADVWLPWGTVDEEFTDCRLVKQDVSGQDGDSKDPVGEPPKLIRVYEQLDGYNETPVGNAGITHDQADSKIVTQTWIQLSAGTAIFQTVGETTALPPNNDAYLQIEETTDDGTLRTITRKYITSGQLSDITEVRYNGKLLVRTLKFIKPSGPPTLPGYTLTATNIEYINGLQVVGYVFAGAAGGGGGGTGGVFSEEVEYRQSDSEGVTEGVTIYTIRYLSAPTQDTNPITPPAGTVLISEGFEDESGYRVWTARYAKGVGTVDTEIETKEGGKLVIYRVTALTVAPSTPSSTIGGTVTLISADDRFADGYQVFSYTWAEGNGEVSREIDYQQSDDAGTTGVTRTTIRHLTNLSTGANPITPPSGQAVISTGFVDQDGYRLWTGVYATGVGIVVSNNETREGGKLIIYKRVQLGSAPTTPGSTIGGTVTLISADTNLSNGYEVFDYTWAEGNGEVSREINYQNSNDAGTTGVTITTIRQLTPLTTTTNPTSGPGGSVLAALTFVMQDGYRLWTAVYGQGTGLIVDEYDLSTTGALALYHRVAINGVPTTPSATLGGTVVLVGTIQRKEEGYLVYDYRWAEGNGDTTISVEGRQDGSIAYTVSTLSAAAETPDNPGGDYLVTLTQTPEGGYFRNTAVYIKLPATVTYRKHVNFSLPGLAAFSGTQLQLYPPVQMDLLASCVVSYGETQAIDTPWTVEFYATFYEAYTIAATGAVITSQKGLGGYLAGPDFVSGSNAVYNGVLCTSFQATILSSEPTARPTGTIVISTDNDPYLTAIDGTRVFRSTVTSVDLP